MAPRYQDYAVSPTPIMASCRVQCRDGQGQSATSCRSSNRRAGSKSAIHFEGETVLPYGAEAAASTAYLICNGGEFPPLKATHPAHNGGTDPARDRLADAISMGLTCPLAEAFLQVPAIKIWLNFDALINAVLSPHVATTALT